MYIAKIALILNYKFNTTKTKITFAKILKKKKTNEFGEITHVAETPRLTLLFYVTGTYREIDDVTRTKIVMRALIRISKSFTAIMYAASIFYYNNMDSFYTVGTNY